MDDSSSATDVIEAIRAVLPAGVALAGGRIGDTTDSPFPEERVAIERAVEKRRRAFVAGRHYARAAMAQLGRAPLPIAVLPSRAPDWPSGLAGSISHAADTCVAVVSTASDFIGVGIDVELTTPLSVGLHATVCVPDELAETEPASDGVDQAKMLFVVKEAFFKLYHPLTGYFLAFLDVSVRLDLGRGTFSLQLRDGPPAVLGRRVFEGSCGHAGRFLFAFVALKA